MKNDTISNLLTSIRNGNMVNKRIVKVPFTKMSLEIIQILKNEGYIENFKKITENVKFYLVIFLKNNKFNSKPIFSKIKRISKPGLRIYSKANNLPTVLNNIGIAIISTSNGIMTNKKAKEKGVGGEILFYIW